MNAALEAIERGIRRAPMMRAALPFMSGLLGARYLPVDTGSGGWIMVIPALILLPVLIGRRSYAHRWWRGAALTILMVSLGWLWWTLRDPFRIERSSGANSAAAGPWLAEVGETSFNGEVVARFECRVLHAEPGSPAPTGARVFLSALLDDLHSAPVRGDRVWITVPCHPIERVPDPGGFDGRSYAASRGIAMEAFAGVGQWRVVGHSEHWTDIFASARAHIARWLEASGLPKRERALAKALLIGVRDELEQDQKAAFARSGTIHVLAVSGAHVGIIWAVLNFLLKRLGNKRIPRIIRGVLILAALWAYAGLTGAEASVLRATIMCSLFTVAGMVLRASGHLNSLFAAAFCLLVWDPLMLWQLSFQLSFLAVLGIILFYKPLLRLWHPPGKVLYFLWSAVAVSLAAQVITTPLSMLVFKSFPVWFLPANLVVAVVVTIAVYGSALLIAFIKVPLLGPALTWCMKHLLLFLGWSTSFFANLPAAYPGIRIDVITCLLLYGLVAAAAAWIAWPGRATRWSTALMTASVLCCWAWNAHRVNHIMRFTVHDMRHEDLVSWQHGRDLRMIGDSATWDDPYLLRRIEAQKRSTGVHRISLDRWGGIEAVEGLALGPWHIGFTGPSAITPISRRPIDMLLLKGDGAYDMDRLRGSIDVHGTVVLSPTINGLERWRVRKWCEGHGIACHDIKRQGAFILEAQS